jgi:hypothetical protein
MKKSFKFLLFCFLFVFFTSSISAQSDYRISLLYDAKMRAVGPYETSLKGEWNFLLRFGYRYKNWEYQAFVENFKSISYGAMGIGVNYLFLIEDSKNRFNRWEIGVGPGVGIIVRQELGVETPFYELNGEFRYFFNKKLGASLLGNMKYRNDLVVEYDEEDPWRLSGFIGLVYRW